MIGVERNGPVRQFRMAAIVKLQGVSIGGASVTVFDVPTLQTLLGRSGELDLIRVESRAGFPTSKLIREIKPILPHTAKVQDAAQQLKEDQKTVSGFTNFIKY